MRGNARLLGIFSENSHRGKFAMSLRDKFDGDWYLVAAVVLPILIVLLLAVFFIVG